MYRRHRPKREINFSFDSFLDVVANVCGIIIRLILVAWVGGRSYHAVMARTVLEGSAPEDEIVVSAAPQRQLPPISDPLEAALDQHRRELARQQQRLLEQLRQCQLLESANAESAQKLYAVATAESAAQQERGQLTRNAAQQATAASAVQLSLADLEKRSRELAKQIEELEKLPPLKKILRYSTPVSRPVHSEELHFECRQGRVAFIDLQAFLIEIRRGIEDKASLLKYQWEVESTTGTVGAFRLHYFLERERGMLDGNGAPSGEGGFRYGVVGWSVEPVAALRGEPMATALATNSEFRRLADAIDPEHTVVTMWVYPDSFELYRKLRDYLHEHNIEVAGRPLPPGMAIASSRQGTASRGQ
jgi:hypothetical protein